MDRVSREVRPAKQPLGTEVKLLPSRIIDCREVRLAKEGKGPAREFPCIESVWRDESDEREEGRVPESFWLGRLMAVTALEESQLMPFHLQKGVSEDQPEGGEVRDLRRSDIAAPSSAEAVEKRRRRRSKGKRRRCFLLRRDIAGRRETQRERERES